MRSLASVLKGIGAVHLDREAFGPRGRFLYDIAGLAQEEKLAFRCGIDERTLLSNIRSALRRAHPAGITPDPMSPIDTVEIRGER